jgi:acyl carrier protein
MDRQVVLGKIADAAVEVLGVERELVTEDASFKDDLDADSLDLVEFVMAVEESFGISIPEEQLQSITTVGAAVSYVVEHSDESAPAETGSAG